MPPQALQCANMSALLAGDFSPSSANRTPDRSQRAVERGPPLATSRQSGKSGDKSPPPKRRIPCANLHYFIGGTRSKQIGRLAGREKIARRCNAGSQVSQQTSPVWDDRNLRLATGTSFVPRRTRPVSSVRSDRRHGRRSRPAFHRSKVPNAASPPIARPPGARRGVRP